MKKDEILKLIHEAHERGVEVYYREEKNGHVHISGIGSTFQDENITQEERLQTLKTIAGEGLTAPSTKISSPKRSYTFRTIESQRRHLQAQEKKITKQYKNPIAPTVTTRIERISKTGKRYTVTKEVQQLDIEKAFRSVQRKYNRASKEYQAMENEFATLAAKERPTGEDFDRMNELESKLKQTPEIIGKMRKSRFQEYLTNYGEQRAREYIRNMSYRTQGMVPVESMQDIRWALNKVIREFRGIKGAPDVSELEKALADFWIRHPHGMKWTEKQELLDRVHTATGQMTQQEINDLVEYMNSI